MPQFMLRADGSHLAFDRSVELVDEDAAERAAIQMLLELRINGNTLLAQGVTYIAVRDADEKRVMDVVLTVTRH